MMSGSMAKHTLNHDTRQKRMITFMFQPIDPEERDRSTIWIVDRMDLKSRYGSGVDEKLSAQL
jgi:hypothetical protein